MYKFKRYKDASLSYTGINRHEDENRGGWDTVISDEDYNNIFSLQQVSMEVPEESAFVAAMAITKPTAGPAVPPISKTQPTVTAKSATQTTKVSTPPPQRVDYSHVRSGTTVRHKAFGKGLVKEIKDGRISVAFDAIVKVFLFPAAFLQGFLYSKT